MVLAFTLSLTQVLQAPESHISLTACPLIARTSHVFFFYALNIPHAPYTSTILTPLIFLFPVCSLHD